MTNHKKNAETYLKRIVQSTKIQPDLKEKFLLYWNANVVSDARKALIAQHAFSFLENIESLHNLENNDKMTKILINNISRGTTQPDGSIKYLRAASKQTKISVIRAFIRWVFDGDTPKYFRKVKIDKKAFMRDLTHEDMITREEFDNMLTQTTDVQTKAMLCILYFTAIRPGEMAQLQIRDIKNINEDVWELDIRKGKTGPREVVVQGGHNEILNWLNNHPYRDNPTALLWVNQRTKKSLSQASISKRIRIVVNKAGRNRSKCFQYLFRHSSIAYWNKMGVDPRTISENAGHSFKTNQEVYGRFSKNDRKAKFRAALGLQEKKVELPATQRCSYCKRLNNAKNERCEQCFRVLDVDSLIEQKRREEQEKSDIKKQLAEQKKMLMDLVKDMVSRNNPNRKS